MSDSHDPARAMFDAYAAAVFERDVGALMRLYHDDVRVFDAWQAWSYEGAAAWRRTVGEWFGSLGTERVRVTADDVRTFAAGDGCGVTAIVTYQGLSAEGAALRAMQNRLTWLLVRDGEGWKIRHEHTSAPIGFADGKAILAREAGGGSPSP